jgi:hypothetical protein
MSNLVECSRCNKVLVDEEYEQHECMPEIKRWKKVKFTHFYISDKGGKKVIGIRSIDGTKYDFEEVLEDKEHTKTPYMPPDFQHPKKTPDDSTEPKIKGKSKLNYNFSKFTNGKT